MMASLIEYLASVHTRTASPLASNTGGRAGAGVPRSWAGMSSGADQTLGGRSAAWTRATALTSRSEPDCPQPLSAAARSSVAAPAVLRAEILIVRATALPVG